MIEDVFARHVPGRPVPHRDDLARRLCVAALRSARTRRWWACSAARDGDAGTSSARRSEAGVRAARRARARAAAHLHLPLSARAGRRDRRLHDPDLAAERAASTWSKGSRRSSSIPPGPYTHSTRGSRRSTTSTDASAISGSARGRRHAATCCSGRTGSSRPPGAIRLARAARALRAALVRGADAAGVARGDGQVARATSIPIATGDGSRRSTSSLACSRRAPRRSCR